MENPYPFECDQATRDAIDVHPVTIQAACEAIVALGGIPPLFFDHDEAQPRVEPAEPAVAADEVPY